MELADFGMIDTRWPHDRPPKPGEAFYCHDWQCPSRHRCAHHFGRSYNYAAMLEPGKDRTPSYNPDRARFMSGCKHYELDRPREWLMGWCEPGLRNGEQLLWCCTGCDAPECPRSTNVVQLFKAGGTA